MERDNPLPDAPAAPAAGARSGRPGPPDPAAPARLLALATSGAWTSVALLRAGPVGHECDSLAEPAGADQSARLLSMIGELLGRAGLSSIDAVAFDAGPGAFTGLRIGCSVAQGLGFAVGLPLVPVGSLEAAAWRSLRQSDADEAVALVANDARMGEVYAAVCAVRASGDPAGHPACELIAEPRLERPDSPPSALSRAAIVRARPELSGRRWILAGDAWRGIALDDGWRGLIRGDDGGRPAAVEAAAVGDARAVAELGLGLWRAGRALAAHEAAPRYVRDKVALDVDEQRALRERRDAAR